MVTPFQLEVRQYVKAVVAGLVAALAFLAGALHGGVDASEVLQAVIAGLSGFAATFYTSNGDAQP